MNLLIAVPTFENIDPQVFKAIYDLDKSPVDICDFEFVKGYDCARARNLIAKKAMKGAYDFVLMVDSDTIIPPDTLALFFESEPSDVVLGIYPRKNMTRKTEIFSSDYSASSQYGYNELEQLRDHHGIKRVRVKGGGLGCALVRTSVFSKIHMPYFLYVCYPDGSILSEDLYFCNKVIDAGGKVTVDTRVYCGHVMKSVKYE